MAWTIVDWRKTGLVGTIGSGFGREGGLQGLEPYLDLAGCEGDARDHARALAPPDYRATIGWYVLRRP